jgi:acetyl esterase/lipase
MIILTRLIVSVILFLCSLLTVVKAPTNLLWKVSILAMEWGHYLALASFALLVFSLGSGVQNRVTAVASLLACILFLTPLIRAARVAGRLDRELEQAFGREAGAGREETPISIKALLLGKQFKKVEYTTYTFSQEGGENLTLDFYPAPGRKAPCIVSIHGGGWDSGDSQQLAELNSYFAGKGYAVASVNYRLAPRHIYPAQMDDIKEAFGFLKKNALELGIDSSQFILMGRSAGGQLALQAAYTFHDPSVRGVIAFYAPADMVWGYSIPGNPWIMDSRLVLGNYIGAGCDLMPEKYVAASPVEQVNSTCPPTLMLHGQADVLVSFQHSIRLRKKLEEHGVRNLLVDLPWATHGYDFNCAGPSAQVSIYAIDWFLRFATAQQDSLARTAGPGKKENNNY